MLKDQNHNLIHQLSEISDSLWRIEKHYLEEAKGCDSCLNLWRELHQNYSEHVSKLTEEIKKHL